MKFLVMIMFALTSINAFADGGHAHLMFKKGAIHAHCTWKKGPISSDESILDINWMNGATHTPMELPGKFVVNLTMPSMPDMTSPATQILRVVDQQGAPMLGAYAVSNMFFTMMGDWEVAVAVSFDDGTKETQTIKVNVNE